MTHKIIILTLLSQSFLCMGMNNPELALTIQDLRAYGASVQNDCKTLAQKANSSFEQEYIKQKGQNLKPAKKQNIGYQNPIKIEQIKRFKKSTPQEEENIDIAALFEKDTQTPEKTFNPASYFDDTELELFYFLNALRATNKDDHVSYGIKYILHQESMLQKPQANNSKNQPNLGDGKTDLGDDKNTLRLRIKTTDSSNAKVTQPKEKNTAVKQPIAQLSDEPNDCECGMCLLGTTAWAGMSFYMCVFIAGACSALQGK